MKTDSEFYFKSVSVTTIMCLQAALGQFQGVLADHQHQGDRNDREDP